MIPREFFNKATSDDLRFIRRWTLVVAVFYSAIAVALFSLVIHQSDTIAARTAPDASHAILIRQ